MNKRHHSKISESNRWHAKLGHINKTTMKTMIHKGLVQGITNVNIVKDMCPLCLLGKQARKAFPQATSYRAEKPLELIHGDMCGPMTPSTPGGNHYIFVVVDDHSRYMWTVLLKEKGGAFLKLFLEQETKEKVGTFRADRVGEFVSHEFNMYCDDEGIKRHLTAPYTLQQDGVVEEETER